MTAVTKKEYNWEELVAQLTEKVPGKTNRISNQRLLLTYKTHLDKDIIRDMLHRLNKKECARIEIAHEIGKKGGVDYPHTHVAVDFGRVYNNKRSDCMRVFDISSIHPNIKPISSVKHWKNTLQYLAKEDPDNKHILEELGDPSESLIDMYLKIRDGDGDLMSHLSEFATKKNEIIPIIQLHKELGKKKRHNWTEGYGRDPKKIDISTRNWYKPILDLDNTPPDNRAIHWFFDPIGNRGKTQFAKYMLANTEKRWEYTNSLGSMKDLSLIIRRMLEGGWKQWGLIVDLTRRSMEFATVYDPIEALKNGIFTSSKYETDRLETLDFHIVVLSNRMPQMQWCSSDRWNIYEIIDNDTTVRVSTPDEIQNCIDKDFDSNEAKNITVNKGLS